MNGMSPAEMEFMVRIHKFIFGTAALTFLTASTGLLVSVLNWFRLRRVERNGDAP